MLLLQTHYIRILSEIYLRIKETKHSIKAKGDINLSSQLFADDVVSLVPSVCDCKYSWEWFAAECEAAEMRISTSKSEAMVLSREPLDCPLQVGNESSPQVTNSQGLVLECGGYGAED